MASFEDDDELQSGKARRARGGGRGRTGGGGGRGGRGGGGGGGDEERDDSWDRESAHIADVTPDDLGTVRCGYCRKYIFEDSVRCPYCKHLQLEEPSHKKPLWIIVAAIVCLIGFAGWLLVGVFDILSWFHR